MLKFVLRKMFSKKWMVLALLLGNILLISIAAGNPMYTQAVLQRTLTKNLESYLTENNAYPGLVTLRFFSPTNNPETVRQYNEQINGMPESFEVEDLYTIRYLATSATQGDLDFPRDDVGKLSICVSTLSDMENHIELVAGESFSAEPDEDGIYSAIISERGLIEKKLLLGDVITLPKLTDAEGNPLKIRVSGVFKYTDPEDVYWVYSPTYYQKDLFIASELFDSFFLEGNEIPAAVNAVWHVLLDYTQMRGENAEHILATAESYRDLFASTNLKYHADNFSDILESYIQTSKKVTVMLWVLQVPIFILLAAFIFMVSRQMIDMEQNEIAVIKSRGAARSQIFGIYLLQSLLISLVSFAIGIPLGVYLCQVLGSSSAFLEFVRRSALPIEINANALLFAGIASLFSVCAMVLPAVKYANISIVNHKRRKNRRSDTPLWQKLFLDVILLGIALYGLYTFNSQKDILAARVQQGASLDPLMFLSSSIFMIGAGLLAVRLMPLIVWAVYRLFRRFWSPALYASFLRVLRTRSSQSFIMVFLIMTIALGVFNAQAARTINQNAEDNIRYSIGADVVLQEVWKNNQDQLSDDASTELVYVEPDFGVYENLEGVDSIAKVYVSNKVSANLNGSSLKDITLMAIHTKDFGETAWFKNSLSDIHWYNYLNAMSQNSHAVLVSRNFETNYKCKLGDSFYYRNSDGESLRGIIYGFVDYFPGFAPSSYTQGSDGQYSEHENYLIVANLQQVQSVWGLAPYQLWMKTNGENDALYAYAEESGKSYTVFTDTSVALIEKKNDPVMQGTNGILTVGFIVVLMLCSVGFLIYWILSIQSRSLMFGIFRAMGMSMREIFTMLLNEQLYISGLSIAVGALVGKLTAKLYIPLIQLAYTSSDNVLPLEIVSRTSDNVRLFSIVGAVMLVCMGILGALISRLKIAQALKLGED